MAGSIPSNFAKFSRNRLGQRTGLLVVGGRVGPGGPRVEDLGGDAGAGLGEAEAEDRVDGERDVVRARRS